jgi:HlyD family secretion protein
VFAVRDGRAVLVPVTVGRNNGTQGEVISGLAAGERVILFPSSALADGSRVAQRHVE